MDAAIHPVRAILLGWAILSCAGHGHRAGAAPFPREDEEAGAGRVVDGLGRPRAGVIVTLEERTPGGETLTLVTDEDGRLVRRDGSGGRLDLTLVVDENHRPTARLAGRVHEYGIDVETKDGPRPEYDAEHNVIILRRPVSWDDADLLSDARGGTLDQGLRELLAAECSGVEDEEQLARFVFENQRHFRPAFRRLVHDPHVGADARHWLDFLGDSRDEDLLPEGRTYAPKDDVREADLVAAIRVAARHRNFFSSAPEPRIRIGFIQFNGPMDRALVQCDINMVAFTGIRWRFVFHKVKDRWVLRSVEEHGRA
jgi:hypothetical protein